MTPQATLSDESNKQEALPSSGIHSSELPSSSSTSQGLVLTIDLIDSESGIAEVEDDQGRNFELPLAWLPAAAEGLAYRAEPHAGGVNFVALAGGARALREKSKQTLLEFSDEHETADTGADGAGETQ
jgi:hypothetical protein